MSNQVIKNVGTTPVIVPQKGGWFTFAGRARRSEYWLKGILLTFVGAVLCTIAMTMGIVGAIQGQEGSVGIALLVAGIGIIFLLVMRLRFCACPSVDSMTAT